MSVTVFQWVQSFRVDGNVWELFAVNRAVNICGHRWLAVSSDGGWGCVINDPFSLYALTLGLLLTAVTNQRRLVGITQNVIKLNNRLLNPFRVIKSKFSDKLRNFIFLFINHVKHHVPFFLSLFSLKAGYCVIVTSGLGTGLFDILYWIIHKHH